MARMQKGWVEVRGTQGRWPIRRLSVKDALEYIAEGGNKCGTEVCDKDGYAVGYLTKAQWAKVEELRAKGGE